MSKSGFSVELALFLMIFGLGSHNPFDSALIVLVPLLSEPHSHIRKDPFLRRPLKQSRKEMSLSQATEDLLAPHPCSHKWFLSLQSMLYPLLILWHLLACRSCSCPVLSKQSETQETERIPQASKEFHSECHVARRQASQVLSREALPCCVREQGVGAGDWEECGLFGLQQEFHVIRA